jgi:membrane associated rhomboid family serine protease
MAEAVERTCYRHPDRVTGLSCSECGRAICTECMTMAPVGIRCPEHAGGQRVVARAGIFDVVGPVTRALIAINVGVYIVELLAGGGVNGTRGWVFEHGALYGPLVQSGDWWRLLTSAFMHYGPFHLLMNMYGLFFAGALLERAIGRWRFLILYLVSGICGSAGVIVYDWLANRTTVALGASGALFGVLGALLVLERRGTLRTEGQILGLIVINLVFTFAFARLISVGGHVGGLIGGAASMLLLVSLRPRPALATAAVVGVGVAAVVIAYAVPIS